LATFTDTAGRVWDVRIDVETIRTIRESELKINLLEVLDPKSGLLERLSDPVMLVDLLYLVCKSQADCEQISPADFGRAMAGDAIAEATDALLESLVNFCPNARLRNVQSQMLKAASRARDQALTAIEAKIADGSLERAMNAALAQHGHSSGDAPGSLESIPLG